LLFVADGARWIREWFEGLGVKDKAMLLCWYHLVKRSQQLLSLSCRGRQHRREVEEPLLRHLWRGEVEEALSLLRQAREQMKKPEALGELVGYLEARRADLPDYAAPEDAGLGVGSNRGGQVNGPANSGRCQ